MPICLFIGRFLQLGTTLASVLQQGKGYIIQLLVTDEQPLQEIKRLVVTWCTRLLPLVEQTYDPQHQIRD